MFMEMSSKTLSVKRCRVAQEGNLRGPGKWTGSVFESTRKVYCALGLQSRMPEFYRLERAPFLTYRLA